MTVVAIDGPAGAGKSTVARQVAQALGFTYVDTGALYRAVALACLEAGVDPAGEAGASKVAEDADISFDGGTIHLDGKDVTSRIRDADVTTAVPVVAAHPGVRRALIEVQRRAAQGGSVVMEGRDIGTTVVPDAPVKIFLVASVEERALRRWRETPGASEDDLSMIRHSIQERDLYDSSREISPLTKAPDARTIDTTGLTIDQVADRIVEIVAEHRHV